MYLADLRPDSEQMEGLRISFALRGHLSFRTGSRVFQQQCSAIDDEDSYERLVSVTIYLPPFPFLARASGPRCF